MTSADPIVPDPLNPQAWNRYSYVGNSPLVFTDPSGHSWLSSFFNSIGNFFKSILQNPIVRAVVQIVIVATLTALTVNPIVGAAISATVVTGLAGGKLGDVVKAAVIATATAVAFYGIGSAHAAIAKEAGPAAAGAFKVASHAGVGCISAVVSGGKCGPGALAQGISAAASASPFMPKDLIGGTATHALVGGLASVAGGGKFENGAVTAAFGYLYNECAHGGCNFNTKVMITGNYAAEIGNYYTVRPSIHLEIRIQNSYDYLTFEGQAGGYGLMSGLRLVSLSGSPHPGPLFEMEFTVPGMSGVDLAAKHQRASCRV